MEIPLYIFLIFYLVGLILFTIWTFFNLYHIMKFGFFDFTGKLNTLFFLCYGLIILGTTFLLLRDIHWTDTVDLFSIFSSFSAGNEFDL